ncbi:MAG: DUF484 family protein [Chromatiaceae bacterium]
MSSQKAEPSGVPESSPTSGDISGRAKASADGADTLEAGLEATVAAYLRTHPEFFERHPDVLADLHVSHVTSGAVSLIEHQVQVLRRQLETERSRLSHLISRARDYESLSNRLHGLVLQLIPAVDLAQLRAALEEALAREFSAEAVTLKLFPIDLEQGGEPDPLTLEFLGFLDREHALCGPLGEDKNQVLFGDLGAGVRSAALVPIRAPGRSGVLAIGATDPERFKPDMGTDLLDRLGEIVSGKLEALLGAPPAVEAEPEPEILEDASQDQGG